MTDYAAEVQPAIAPADAPDADKAPGAAARSAITTPYTFGRWRADLAQTAAAVQTGFDVLADVRLLWNPGLIYGVIARPGGAKTGFLLEAVMRYLEAEDTRTAAFLSYEMPVSALVLRLLLREDARLTWAIGREADAIHRWRVRQWGASGDAGDAGYNKRLAAAETALEPKLDRLRLVDGDALGRVVTPILEALAQLSRERETERFGLVAVDYFQKLRAGGPYWPTRQTELQAVADLLRRFAKGGDLAGGFTGADNVDPSHAVPVLVAAQVTRGSGDHPTGDDVREADDLLNDAGGIVALSRETVDRTIEDESRNLRVSVPKNREGQTRGEAEPLEVARIPWRPARDWFGDSGRPVKWTALDDRRATDNGPGGRIGTGTGLRERSGA